MIYFLFFSFTLLLSLIFLTKLVHTYVTAFKTYTVKYQGPMVVLYINFNKFIKNIQNVLNQNKFKNLF